MEQFRTSSETCSAELSNLQSICQEKRCNKNTLKKNFFSSHQQQFFTISASNFQQGCQNWFLLVQRIILGFEKTSKCSTRSDKFWRKIKNFKLKEWFAFRSIIRRRIISMVMAPSADNFKGLRLMCWIWGSAEYSNILSFSRCKN